MFETQHQIDSTRKCYQLKFVYIFTFIALNENVRDEKYYSTHHLTLTEMGIEWKKKKMIRVFYLYISSYASEHGSSCSWTSTICRIKMNVQINNVFIEFFLQSLWSYCYQENRLHQGFYEQVYDIDHHLKIEIIYFRIVECIRLPSVNRLEMRPFVQRLYCL